MFALARRVYRSLHLNSRLLYRRRFHAAFLVGLWIFQVANLVYWESQNKELLAFDEVGHFLASTVVWKVLSASWNLFDLPRFVHALPNGLASWVSFNFSIFPPFVYLVTAVLYFFAPASLAIAALTNAIFLIILLVAVYGIADEMLGSSAGLVAALLVSGYPLLVGLTRLYFLDFPLTSMVALNLFLLIKTRKFQDRNMALLLSISLILGMLTKHPFPLYVAGPFLYVAAKSCRDHTARKNIVLCLALASIALLYYVLKPGGLGVYSWYTDYAKAAGLTFETPPFIAAFLYLRVLAQGIGNPLFALFGIGFLLFLKLEKRSRMFMLTGILVPISLVGVVYPVWYDPRFVAPILPMVAVTSSCFFRKFNWRRRYPQLLAALAISVFVFAQYASISYNVPIVSGFYAEGSNAAPGAHPPVESDWRIPEILSAIEKDAIGQHSELPVIVALSIDYHFDQTLFEYYSYVNGINAIIPPNYGQFSTAEGIKIVNSANYVVTRSNPDRWFGAPAAFIQNLVEVSKYVQSCPSSFVLLSNYTLPDGSVASLYRTVFSASSC